MKAIYINFDKQINVNINLNSQNKALRLFNWLETYHDEIFGDIEMHETGKNGVSIDADEITFSGDNGIFIMERIKITEI